MRKINAISLCAGIGGLDLGLRLADDRIQTVAYVERETCAAATIVARMADKTLDKAPIWDDIETFPCGSYRGKVDFVFGGIPCQPFSCAGKQGGIKDERWLWRDFWKIVCSVGARTIFIENVPNFINHGLETILGTLAKTGWDAEWGVFSARDCGATHLRKRFFLFAHPHTNRCNRERVSKIQKRDEGKCLTRKCKTMGDSHIEGLERFRIDGECSNKQFTWPPGPTEHKQWSAVEAHLKPAVCRVVDGPSAELVTSALEYQKERLRCLGNAVVPVVAALAYRELKRRMKERGRGPFTLSN